MSERKITFSNYRNLGIKSETSLILNNTTKKDQLGGLVILIGPNNSGKSNIIDGLLSLTNGGRVTADDIPDFILDNPPTASVTLTYKNGDDIFSYRKNSSNEENFYFTHGNAVQDENTLFESAKQAFNKMASFYNANLAQYGLFNEPYNKIINGLSHPNEKKQVVADIRAFYKAVQDYSTSHYDGLTSWLRQLLNRPDFTDADRKALGLPGGENTREGFEKEFLTTFNYPFLPQIHLYQEQEIRNSMFSGSPSSWKNSPLLVSLFKSLGITDEIIANAYASYQKKNNIRVLSVIEAKYKPKVDEIAARFNTLYNQGKEKYIFELRFDRDEISFGVSLNDTPLNYSKQSTGFKWFFDLFFNYLNNTSFNPGDILVMDEPGIRLHIHGQEELRAFLKDFALKNDITIVISTHSPFLIDPDNFDELRLVNRIGDSSEIKNDFHLRSDDYPDTLCPIITALTTRNSVVLDPAKRKIFVEGITDYDYLTAFKILCKIDNVVFLPINGLGKKGEEKEKISDLLAIDRDPILLTDGDQAGIAFQAKAKDTGLTVVKLTDVNPAWKEIEDLFSDKEKADFNLANKKGPDASILKQEIVSGAVKVSSSTQDNFQKLLDYLSDNL
jgi:predicted ATP-dependent endonuclease of OLD family